MADEFPIKVVVEVDDSKAEAEGQQAGAKIAEGIEKTAKPDIKVKPTLDQAAMEALEQQMQKAAQSMAKSLGITVAQAAQNIIQAAQGGRLPGPGLPGLGFPGGMGGGGAGGGGVGGGGAGGGGAGGGPPPPPQMISFAQQLQPFLSGLEAVTMLLKGAPLLSVAQMAGQAITQYQTAQALQRLAAAGGATGGGGGGGGGGIPPIVAAGGAGGLLGRLLPFGAAVGGAVGVGYAVESLRDAIGELGTESARTSLKNKQLQDVMGASNETFARQSVRFAEGGVHLEDYGRQMARLAVRARQEMDTIQKAHVNAADNTELAYIKFDRAGLRYIASQDQQESAALKTARAEVALQQFRETGAEARERRLQATQLGVEGAGLGLRGAQMGRAAADVQRQFAPREAELAEIAGPLTVAGARLGEKGAELARDEQRIRSRAAAFGEAPDEEQLANIARRKQAQADAIAENNVRQAKLGRMRAEEEEEKRQAKIRAGVGPVQEAEQQAAAAAHGEKMQGFNLREAELRAQNEEILQKRYTLQLEQTEVELGLRDAVRGQRDADLGTKEAKIGLNRQAQELEEYVKYQDPKVVQEAMFGRAVPEGFDVRKVGDEAQRQALFREGGFKPAGIVDAISQYFRSDAFKALPKEEQPLERLETIRNIFGTRLPDAAGIGGILATDPSQRTAAQNKRTEELTKQTIEGLEKANIERQKAIKLQENQDAIQQRLDEERTGRAAEPFTLNIGKRKAERTAAVEQFKRWGLQGLEAVGGLIPQMPGEEHPLSGEALPPGKSALDMLGLGLKLGPEQLLGIPGLQPLGLMGLLGKFGMSAGAAEFVQPPELTKPPEEAVKPVTDAGQQAGSEITSAGQQAGTAISTAGSEISSALNSAGTEAAGAVSRGGDEVAGALSAAAAAIAAIQFTPPQQASGGGGTIEAIEEQAGGFISGPGSETSDSIPARLSHGEYVIKASSVRKIGVSNLDALNEGQGFAEGGGVQYEGSVGQRERERLGYGPPTGPGWDISPKNEKAGRGGGVPEALKAATAEWRESLRSSFAEGGAITSSTGQAQADYANWLKESGFLDEEHRMAMFRMQEGLGFQWGGFARESRQHKAERLAEEARKKKEAEEQHKEHHKRAVQEAVALGLKILRERQAKKAKEAATAPGGGGGSYTPEPPKTQFIKTDLFGKTLGSTDIPKPSAAPKDDFTWRKDPATGTWQRQSILRPDIKQIALKEPPSPPGPEEAMRRGPPGFIFAPGQDPRQQPPSAAPGAPRIIQAPSTTAPPTTTPPFQFAPSTPAPSILTSPPPFPEGVPLPRPRMRPDDLLERIEQLAPKQPPPPPKTMEQRREELGIEPAISAPPPIGAPGSGGDQIVPPPREPPPTSPWPRSGELDVEQSTQFAEAQIEEERRRREEEPEYARLGGLVRGFANGGLVGGFADAIAGAQGFTGSASVSKAGNGNSALGFHQLDIRTNAGNFNAGVSEGTMEDIRRSSLSSKLSQTGPRPTWYS